MTAEHERFVEDLAAYVLGSLEAEEYPRVEAHVATCTTCARLVAEYRAVVGMMPAGLETVTPPEAAWREILASARRRHPGRRSAPRAMRPNWLRAARWPTVAVLVALLVVWNVMLERELARRAPGPAPGPEVEALSRRPGRILILQGTGTPGASARIFVAVDGGGHLAVSGLAFLPQDRTYQLWFVRRGAPAVSGATFRADGYGRAWAKVAVPASLDDVSAILVTREPAPGSVAPTGPHLLEATAWR
ncbi:MAG TPA: anti-sigma factor [Methylomirabilota bacterium]|nr:anti-sigma factor [Methylomirabilota bacterium]